jgi:hypothetical protein
MARTYRRPRRLTHQCLSGVQTGAHKPGLSGLTVHAAHISNRAHCPPIRPSRLQHGQRAPMLANICTHPVFMMVHVVMGRVSCDNTRRFPVMSNRGSAYVALFYIYDENAIWSVPIKNRSKEELLRAVIEVYAWLMAREYRPILHKMDNETSHDVKPFIALEQVKLQYCPL